MIHDKADIDIKAREIEIRESWFDRRYLHTNSFFAAYYPVEPCVIVEELISDIATGVDEYKFLCFDGEPKYIYHSDDHFRDGQWNECSVSYFDTKWNNLGIRYGNHPNNPNAKKPVFLQEMMEISKVLSKDFSSVRVDFFETDKRIYLAEMTFAQGSGLTPFVPDEFDFELGRMWEI